MHISGHADNPYTGYMCDLLQGSCLHGDVDGTCMAMVFAWRRCIHGHDACMVIAYAWPWYMHVDGTCIVVVHAWPWYLQYDGACMDMVRAWPWYMCLCLHLVVQTRRRMYVCVTYCQVHVCDITAGNQRV